jgi:hypothetical protein
MRLPLNESLSEETHLESKIQMLMAYCQANDWAGYDPFDAVNSSVFAALPFLNTRFPRLVLTQALKRSPVNIRRFLGIPKTQNPKAIALFLSAFLKLSRTGMAEAGELIEPMIERLAALRSQGVPYWCWGYSFPWQTRTIVVPAGAPNLVCTTFVCNALLDAYEQRQDERCLGMATSTAEYVQDVLYWTDGASAAGYSYPVPGLRNLVHNANLLGAALLCRVYKHTRQQRFLSSAMRVARCAAAMQHADGSWRYGEAQSQKWIDNFHTGYNLCALRDIGRDAGTSEFESSVRRGLEFYRAHFFREDGAPKYFHNRPYPVDIHSVAQSIITLVALKDLHPSNIELARSVFQWTMDHMWDERGFFYYRVLRLCTIRISYMRWAQAWMLLAMSVLRSETETPVTFPQTQDSAACVEAC